MNLKPLRYRIEYVLGLAFARTLQALPVPVMQATGRCLGRAAWALGVSRAMAHQNLRERLGLEGAALRATARAAYAGFGQTIAEIAFMPALKPEIFDGDATFRFEGLEHVDQALALGKGAVCFSGHYGNWEWMGAALVRRGYPITFLIGTQSNPHTDLLFQKYRERLGMQQVRIRSIKDCLRAVKQNRLVAVVGDQDGDKYGVFAPFFGVDASTYGIGTLLARKSGAALLYGVAQRQADGSSLVKVHRLAGVPEGLSEDQATALQLEEYNRLLEADIRADPGQWLWMHHRWLSKPEHRLAGEERLRAERGEIHFDWRSQSWKDASGVEVKLETWR